MRREIGGHLFKSCVTISIEPNVAGGCSFRNGYSVSTTLMKLFATLVFETGQCHLLESRGTQDNNNNLGINEFIETQHDGPLMGV